MYAMMSLSIISFTCIVILAVAYMTTYHDLQVTQTAFEEYREESAQAFQSELNLHEAELQILNTTIADLQTENAILLEDIAAMEVHIAALEEIYYLPDEVINLTEADLIALKKVAMAEAGNQGVIGKALVMRVVLNRVAHPTKFANSAEAVILSGAFTVTQPGGGYWTCVPDWECDAALYLILHGWDESNGVMYFTNQGYSVYGDPDIAFQYKNHYFN